VNLTREEKDGNLFPTCFVIAEAGVNHNGDIDLAKRLVDAAVDAGASAIKFQAFRAEELASLDAPKAAYQLAGAGRQESQLAMLKRLELPPQAFEELFLYCGRKNILFLASPFDLESTDLLDSLGMPYFKIASGEITNYPLLHHVAGKGKPMILSTGMSTMEEVQDSLNVVSKAGNDKVILLHCVTEYPAPPEEVNLQAMLTMREACGVPVGYSDHTLGIEIALAAVALGASVIEKHMTLSRDMEGPDHRASLEPHEFKQMVRQIRNIEVAMGDGVKRPALCETINRRIARRSIFAAVEISAGDVICAEMLAYKRPGKGISPTRYKEVIGRRVSRSFQAGELLDWEWLHDC
jgi:N-acetylneuraminate synthase/N,N'-diacetyllegionaminate synthase